MKTTFTIFQTETSRRMAFAIISICMFAFLQLFSNNSVAQVCCPEFILKDAVEICPVEGACMDGESGGQSDKSLAACKESAHVYTVYPNDPAYTYTWTVTGGTPTGYTGNPNVITWGSGSVGYIKVVVSNIAFGGNCLDSITAQICLIDGPEANFLMDKDTVCVNTPVHFTNLSLGGSAYLWDFGDGTTSILANPADHTYSAPGTYTVTLTATDMGAGQWVIAGDQAEILVPCGCSDTITKTIVVLPGEGPTIETDCCYGTVCAGDTSSFCSPAGCSSYLWTVTGGTIISGLGSNCVKVVWASTYSGPTTISLQTPGCSSAPCDGITTLNVPVLYPNFPISGPATLCQGASGTFSLPTLPGTYYTWSVSGGGFQFNLQDRNTPSVNITFNDAATYTIKCDYDNPLAGCSGSSIFTVSVLPEFTITYGEETVCEGETKPYFTNGPANWNVSPVGPSIIGSGSTVNILWNAPGNYVITASPQNPANFCNTSAIKVVEVIAKPILNSIVGNDTVCPGSNNTYSISSDTQGSLYVWAITGGTGNIQSEMGADRDSVIVHWTGSGPWQLSVYQEIEITPGNFCTSLTKVLDVYPYPLPVISGPSAVCVDASETYTAGISSPSVDLQWSITPSNQGTIQSGQGTNSVTVLWHGPSATATLTASNCVGSDSNTVVITGPPNAVVSYSQLPIFCLGDAVTLTLSTPAIGGYSYQWYKDGSPVPSATSSTLPINIASFGSTGTYQYYVKVTHNSCTVISNIIDVIIKNCTAGTPGGPPGPGNCDVIAYFWSYVECNQVTLLDKSYTVGAATITSYLWTVTGPGTGVFSPSATNPNPVLTVSASGTYTIKLKVTSSTGCTSEWTQSVNILLPVANISFTAPLCDNASVMFYASPNNPNYNYAWDFGDGFTSFTANTEHIYGPPAPANYTVKLVITDEKGCVASASKIITVNPSPVCTISASDTIFCPGSFETLTACSAMGSYQWYKNGNPISGETLSTYDVYTHGEYWVEVTNSFGCTNKSNKIYMYVYSLPVAKLTGEGHICAYPSTISGVYLTANYDANYTYSWSSNPSGASFSPATNYSTWASLTLPAVLPATYEFIVQVTDNTTGCINSDTLCVTFFETPTLSVPYLNICEGSPVTLTPTPNDTSKYSYQWNNGAITPTIIASAPGHYSLTITDKANGCSAYADAGLIFAKPDLSLFPLGCADICPPDTLNLYIPLALNALWPNNTYPSAYPSITWYDNGNYASPIGYGENLYFPAANTGSHQISVVVQNSFGCVDTAGVFCLQDDVCCEIVLDYIRSTDAGCAQSSDGIISMMLNPSSIGGPFTLTKLFPAPVQSWVITPGVPFSLTGLAPGSYSFQITTANGDCKEFFDLSVGFLQEDCCLAALDSNFIHINAPVTYTSDMVWDNKYFIADGVMVTVDGVVLDISVVDVVFGECAGIEFINGGYLRANNSVFRPCDIDKSWKGLRFDTRGEFDNIINESTFKNAEVALYFQNGADGVVSNNLFSNCNYGVRVENNNDFNHPISGNRFVTEDFFPDFACDSAYSFVNNNSTYGVYSTSSRFLKQLSHNEFINSKGKSSPGTFGIYQIKGGGVFSENTFTDIGMSVYLYSALFYSSVENNEIEVNMESTGNFTSIYIIACQAPVVEIMNNEISNNYDKFMSFSAIYTYASDNISIVGNDIVGFNYGIIDISSVNHQISNNVIDDCQSYGIYVYELPNSRGFITCNSITMKSFTSSVGLVAYNISAQSEVSSNCINDCNVSMSFYGWSWGGNTPLLPLIRNNFLYNYNYVGINVQGYSGNIGTITSPGLNTLWSNNNSAIDINSSSTINVADNFGMFNISFPQVQITSNNPYHSTASCGHQIFNMPSQGNLDINYDCDNSEQILNPLSGGGGNFMLKPEYASDLKNSPNQFESAAMIMASIAGADLNLLEQLIQNTDLSLNEVALLKYDYFSRIALYSEARSSMESYTTSSDFEINFKSLSLVNLDVMEHGWQILSQETIDQLMMISETDLQNANFAISLLNNVSGFHNHVLDEPLANQVIATGNIKRVEQGHGFLSIYPNPVKDIAYIELFSDINLGSKVELYDISGKLCTQFTINFVAGGIELDISNLKAGIYVVTLTNPDSGIAQKGKLVKLKQD